MPKVSVIITTYNCAKYIGQSINSVLDQTYKDYEIVVVDDGSNDNTREVLEPFMDKIKYIYQNNKGTPAARNKGVLNASGEFVAFHDADDVWYPFKLERQMKYLEENNEAFVYSKMIIKNLSGHVLGYKPNIKKEYIYPYVIPNIPYPTVVMKKNSFSEIGLFDCNVLYMSDFELFFRFSRKFKLHYIDEVVGIYRKHDFNTTSNKNELKKYKSRVYIDNKILKNYNTSLKNKILLQNRLRKNQYLLSKIYLKKGYFEEAFNLLLKVIFCSPLIGIYFIKINIFKWLINIIKPYLELIFAASAISLRTINKQIVFTRILNKVYK